MNTYINVKKYKANQLTQQEKGKSIFPAVFYLYTKTLFKLKSAKVILFILIGLILSETILAFVSYSGNTDKTWTEILNDILSMSLVLLLFYFMVSFSIFRNIKNSDIYSKMKISGSNEKDYILKLSIINFATMLIITSLVVLYYSLILIALIPTKINDVAMVASITLFYGACLSIFLTAFAIMTASTKMNETIIYILSGLITIVVYKIWFTFNGIWGPYTPSFKKEFWNHTAMVVKTIFLPLVWLHPFTIVFYTNAYAGFIDYGHLHIISDAIVQKWWVIIISSILSSVEGIGIFFLTTEFIIKR